MLSTFESTSATALVDSIDPRFQAYRFDADPHVADADATDDMRRIDFLPTPAQIARSCAEIRSGWTQSEKRRRFVGQLPIEEEDDVLWAPPVIDTSHLRHAMMGASLRV